MRLQQLANIEAHRKEALAKLNIKYAIADKVKTSFGYIGITSLNTLFWSIFLNDFVKLVCFLYQYIKHTRKQRQEMKARRIKAMQIEREELEQVKIQMEQEEYSRDLEEKLEKVHMRLVQVCAQRRMLQTRKLDRKKNRLP